VRRGLLLLAAASVSSGIHPAYAHRTELQAELVVQQKPSWCWAATASMALKFLGFPDINPARNYQCGVVAAAFPNCEDDCTKCDMTLEGMPSFVNLLERYRDRTRHASTSFQPYYLPNPDFRRIKQSIDLHYPVIVGVSADEKPTDPALAEHAVLITGYDDDHLGTGEPWVVVLDPYPYRRGENPWANAGFAAARARGPVLVPWSFMQERMNLSSAVFLQKATA
jgi:hypothetical protein